MNRPTLTTRANGVNTSFSYNTAGELTGMSTSNAALPAEGYPARSYSRNSAGMIERIVESDGEIVFGYDLLYRLISAVRPPAAQAALPSES